MKNLRYIDYWIAIPYLILSVLGIIMVYSASADIGVQNGGSAFGYLVKQTIFVILGLCIVGFMIMFNLNKLRNKRILQFVAIGFIVVLMGLLLFGKTINGAAGWIQLPGGISLQPAEFIKFFIIIYLAHMIDRRQNDLEMGYGMTRLRQPMILVGIMVLLIFLQPDLGGATINATIIFVMFLASGFNWRRASAYLIGAIAAVVLIVLPLAGKLAALPAAKDIYQLQRIVAFMHPFDHQQTVGQQLVNSFYALSNGGIFGVGLGNSIQKTGYLPEPNTDFIMAILAEELGLIVAVAVIALLFMIILRAIMIGSAGQQAFFSLICYGSAAYMTIQTLFNVGGVLGLLPITGVTFPFISYGGSSTLTLALVIGTLLNISAHQKRGREQQVKRVK